MVEKDFSSNMRWVWIGCGGCLGLVILLVLLSVIGGSFVYRYASDVKQNMEALELDIDRLNRIYPFTVPENDTVEEKRYREFLSIRSQVVQRAAGELEWLFEWMGNENKPHGLERVKMGFKVVGLFKSLNEVGRELTRLLFEHNMSMDEYRYLTGITVGTLYSWCDMEEEDLRNKTWLEYFEPVAKLTEAVDQVKKEHADAAIDLGDFEQKRIIHQCKDQPIPSPDMIKIIEANREYITGSTSSIFVDMFILRELR